ncbi:FAD-dependent monooxygenase [Amycolatopsis thermalba]|uniref:FAD-dependent monooxygenase n=1 Tax=Amycolatopsis thermalba TaxID=944492 RepID=A0ABY4NZ20_9PSEU|nr:FAD-dependent monooxygenase [Amycolatopsis thermalba]
MAAALRRGRHRPARAVHRLARAHRAGQLDVHPRQGPRRVPVVGPRRARRPHRVHRRPARRTPLRQWSKRRATLVGDAAHATSPYAAYGAGMATEDGYFLGRRLAGADLSDYAAVRAALDAFEAPRKPHTARQVQQACVLGRLFHHAPAHSDHSATRSSTARRRILLRGDHRPARGDRRSGGGVPRGPVTAPLSTRDNWAPERASPGELGQTGTRPGQPGPGS